MRDIKGHPVSFADFKGKVFVLLQRRPPLLHSLRPPLAAAGILLADTRCACSFVQVVMVVNVASHDVAKTDGNYKVHRASAAPSLDPAAAVPWPALVTPLV